MDNLKGRPRKSPWLVWLMAIIVLAGVAYALIAWYPGTPVQVKNAVGVLSPGQQRAQEFSSVHAGTLLTFTDPLYGYSLRYPQGYLAQLDPEPGVRLRFIADTPLASSEVIDFGVSNATDGKADFDSAAGNYTAQELEFAGTDVINGRTASLLGATITSDYTNETLFIRQSFIPCPATTAQPGVGDYWVEETAVVPEALAGDIPLAEYMAYSLTC